MTKEPFNSFANRLIRNDELVEFMGILLEKGANVQTALNNAKFLATASRVLKAGVYGTRGEKDCPSCGFVMTDNGCRNSRCVDFHNDGD